MTVHSWLPKTNFLTYLWQQVYEELIYYKEEENFLILCTSGMITNTIFKETRIIQRDKLRNFSLVQSTVHSPSLSFFGFVKFRKYVFHKRKRLLIDVFHHNIRYQLFCINFMNLTIMKVKSLYFYSFIFIWWRLGQL